HRRAGPARPRDLAPMDHEGRVAWILARGAAATEHSRRMVSPPRALILAAFAAVYVIWGSTYLAIKVTLETLPPLSAAAFRFLAAGALLYAFARARGHAAPERRHWPGLVFVGGLLLLGGNGGVSW